MTQTVSAAPAGGAVESRASERAELEQCVRKYGLAQPWNHNYALPHGVETRPGAQLSHGKNEVKLERIKPLLEAIGLEGTQVLDVGCNEGYFSFYAASRGAKVVGIDVDAQRIEKARFVQSVLNVRDVELSVMDIYGPEFGSLPRFGLCLCMGFLHRIPDPFSALAALAGKSSLMLIEWKALKFGPHDDAFAYFSPKEIDRADYFGTEYWLLSYAAVERILRRLGFSRFHRVDDPTQRRAILVAGRDANPVFDRPDVRIHGGRVRGLLRHTRRYFKTVLGVLSGKINA